MNERANPFGDLGDFAPAPATAKPKPDPAVLNQVAEAHGFPSRQPTKAAVDPAPASPATPAQEEMPRLRKASGRTHQVNIKTTFEAKKRLIELSAENRMTMGEVLELAIEALEKSWKAT